MVQLTLDTLAARVAEGLGFALERVDEKITPVLAKGRVKTPHLTVQAGQVAGNLNSLVMLRTLEYATIEMLTKRLRQAFAARAHGAEIRVNCELLEIEVSGDRITGVVTDEQGIARLTFTLPERATAWKLLAKGITVDTLAELRAEHPRARLYFLIGSDNLPLLPTWRDHHRVLGLATVVTYPRLGHPVAAGALERLDLTPEERRLLLANVLDVPADAFAASELRRQWRAGSRDSAALDPAVAAYVEANGLYR